MFSGSDLSLIGLPNPIIVRSRPGFLFETIFHLLMVFFVHMRHFYIDYFDLIFLKNGCPNSLIGRSRYSFLFSH